MGWAGNLLTALSGHGLACPEHLLLKCGTCLVQEESVGKPSPGNCRDMLPEEAKDLG